MTFFQINYKCHVLITSQKPQLQSETLYTWQGCCPHSVDTGRMASICELVNVASLETTGRWDQGSSLGGLPSCVSKHMAVRDAGRKANLQDHAAGHSCATDQGYTMQPLGSSPKLLDLWPSRLPYEWAAPCVHRASAVRRHCLVRRHGIGSVRYEAVRVFMAVDGWVSDLDLKLVCQALQVKQPLHAHQPRAPGGSFHLSLSSLTSSAQCRAPHQQSLRVRGQEKLLPWCSKCFFF